MEATCNTQGQIFEAGTGAKRTKTKHFICGTSSREEQGGCRRTTKEWKIASGEQHESSVSEERRFGRKDEPPSYATRELYSESSSSLSAVSSQVMKGWAALRTLRLTAMSLTYFLLALEPHSLR